MNLISILALLDLHGNQQHESEWRNHSNLFYEPIQVEDSLPKKQPYQELLKTTRSQQIR
jgi:hypothetical protein